MPYKLVRDGDGYYVVSPHGTYLSKSPLSYEQAIKQKTAVTLSELRKEKQIAGVSLRHHPEQSHVYKIHHVGDAKEELVGATHVPVSRDTLGNKGRTIPIRDIFAPLPLPHHHLPGKGMTYTSHG